MYFNPLCATLFRSLSDCTGFVLEVLVTLLSDEYETVANSSKVRQLFLLLSQFMNVSIRVHLNRDKRV